VVKVGPGHTLASGNCQKSCPSVLYTFSHREFSTRHRTRGSPRPFSAFAQWFCLACCLVVSGCCSCLSFVCRFLCRFCGFFGAGLVYLLFPHSCTRKVQKENMSRCAAGEPNLFFTSPTFHFHL